jgi:hypothetical protein
MSVEIYFQHRPASDSQFLPGFCASRGHPAAHSDNRERFGFCRWADNFRPYRGRSEKPPLGRLSQPTPSVNVRSPSTEFSKSRVWLSLHSNRNVP